MQFTMISVVSLLVEICHTIFEILHRSKQKMEFSCFCDGADDTRQLLRTHA